MAGTQTNISLTVYNVSGLLNLHLVSMLAINQLGKRVREWKGEFPCAN